VANPAILVLTPRRSPRPARFLKPGRSALPMIRLVVSICGVWLLAVVNSPAELVTDGSLGPTVALDGPAYQIEADLGQQAGANLFHSFSQFNLNAGDSATFTGPGSVQNIISRVTGGQLSTIDGQLASTIPGANLFLLNPAGWLFGPHASLAVDGDVHLSTAAVLHLGEQARFNATPDTSTILSVAPPTAFGFLGAEPAAIQMQGSRLTATPGQTLSFSAGSIALDSSRVNAEGGALRLDTRSGSGTASLTENTAGPGQGEIRLTKSRLSVGGNQSGHLRIQGGQFMMQQSELSANNGNAMGGSIALQVADATLDSSTILATTLGTGPGANIRIATPGNLLLTDTQGQKLSAIQASSVAVAGGDSGSIGIQAGNLSLENGGLITSATLGSGRGGNISLTIAGTARFDSQNPAQIALIASESRGELTDAGVGGDVSVQANQVTLSGNNARFSTASYGSASGGTLTVQAADMQVSGKDNGLFATAQGAGVTAGNGGQINLQADRLTLADNATISSVTTGSGQAGTINVQAAQIEINQAGIGSASLASSSEAGNAGNITLTARDALRLSNQAEVTTAATQAGGGQIQINNQGLVAVQQQSKITTSVQDGSGNGGNIDFSSPRFVVLNNGKVIAQAFAGNGGNIHIGSQHYLGTPGSLVDASSKLGIDGAVVIESPSPEVAKDLVVLPDELLSAQDLEHEVCARSGEQSRLVATGREGIPNAQEDWLPSGPLLNAPSDLSQVAPTAQPTAAITTAHTALPKSLATCANASKR